MMLCSCVEAHVLLYSEIDQGGLVILILTADQYTEYLLRKAQVQLYL